MEDLLTAMRSKAMPRRSSEAVSLVEGVKRELQSFAKSVGVFGTPLFSVAVLLVTNCVKRRCTLSDILCANEDANVTVADAVEFLLEFRRTTKNADSIVVLDCLLGSLSFWRRLETRVQKLCYVLNYTHTEYAFALVLVFAIDTLKSGGQFVPRLELMKDVTAAASAVLCMLAQTQSTPSGPSRFEFSRLDELNMRVAFLEWLAKAYNLNESALADITDHVSIESLVLKIMAFADKSVLVKRGSMVSLSVLPWSPLEVGNIPDQLLDEIDLIAVWPQDTTNPLKRTDTNISSPIKRPPVRGGGLTDPDAAEDAHYQLPVNEAEIDRQRQRSQVLLKRTNTVVPDSPFKRQEAPRSLQRFASAPPQPYAASGPATPPVKRPRLSRPVQKELVFKATQVFSITDSLFEALSKSAWNISELRSELIRLGLVEPGLCPVEEVDTALLPIEAAVDACVAELTEHGGPLRTSKTQDSSRKSKTVAGFVKLLLALSCDYDEQQSAVRWPSGLATEGAIKCVCALGIELLAAEGLIQVEPTMEGTPQNPTVLNASVYSGFVFSVLGVWLQIDWMELYVAADVLVDPALRVLLEVCGSSSSLASEKTQRVKEELLRNFIFREESGFWGALAVLRRCMMRRGLEVCLETASSGGSRNSSELVESCVHVVFLFSCIKLLDVTSRCSLGSKTSSILNLTIDLLRAVFLYKTHLFRNRDLYEILACCLITAARLFKNKLSFTEIREAFALSAIQSPTPGDKHTLTLTFDQIAISSNSLHSGLVAFDTVLERSLEGHMRPTLLDSCFPTSNVEHFHTHVFLPETEVFLSLAHRVVENKSESLVTSRTGHSTALSGYTAPDASPFTEAFFGGILRSSLRKIHRRDEYTIDDWKRALSMSSPLGELDCLFPVLPGAGRSQGGFAWIKGVLVKEQGEDIQVISLSTT